LTGEIRPVVEAVRVAQRRGQDDIGERDVGSDRVAMTLQTAGERRARPRIEVSRRHPEIAYGDGQHGIRTGRIRRRAHDREGNPGDDQHGRARGRRAVCVRNVTSERPHGPENDRDREDLPFTRQLADHFPVIRELRRIVGAHGEVSAADDVRNSELTVRVRDAELLCERCEIHVAVDARA
jgi:hypothetical protein